MEENKRLTNGGANALLGLEPAEASVAAVPMSPTSLTMSQMLEGRAMALRRKVFRRLLQGYTPDEVASEFSLSVYFVKEQLAVARQELHDWHESKLAEQVEESVEVYNMVAKVAWGKVNADENPRDYLRIIMDTQKRYQQGEGAGIGQNPRYQRRDKAGAAV